MLRQSLQPTREHQRIFKIESDSKSFQSCLPEIQIPESHQPVPSIQFGNCHHLNFQGIIIQPSILQQLENFAHSLLSLNLQNWYKISKTVIYLIISRLVEVPEVICRMSSLIQLNLSFNYLQVVENNIVQHRNLQVLHLHNNLIRKINCDFTKSTSLISLDLKNNYLNEFPCIRKTKLKEINLLENLLQTCCSCILQSNEIKTDWQNYVLITEKKCGPVNLFETLLTMNPKKEEIIVKACQYNHISVALALIQNYPKLMITFVQIRNQQQVDSLLVFTFKRARFRIFKILIDAGIIQKYPNLHKEFKYLFYQYIMLISNLLILAAQNLDLENLNLLINQGLFAYSKDSNGNSLLHIVFQQFNRNETNAKKICERLLKLGLDPNKLNNEKKSPLQLAIIFGQRKAVQFAVNYNRGSGFPKFDFHQINETDNSTLMHLATVNGDIEIIQLLNEENLSLRDFNVKNRNPKQIANTHITVIKMIQKLEKLEIRRHLLYEHKRQVEGVVLVKSKQLVEQEDQENEANLSDTSQDSQLLQIKNQNFQENMKEQQNMIKRKFIQSLKHSREDFMIGNEDSEPFIEEMDEMMAFSNQQKRMQQHQINSIQSDQDLKSCIYIPNSCEKQTMRSINHKLGASDIFERILHQKNLRESLDYFIFNVENKDSHFVRNENTQQQRSTS